MSDDSGAYLLAPLPKSLELERMKSASFEAQRSTAKRRADLYDQISERLDDHGRKLLGELDNLTGECICDFQTAVLDHLVIGFFDPDSAPGGMEWRTTRRTEIDVLDDHLRNEAARAEARRKLGLQRERAL